MKQKTPVTSIKWANITTLALMVVFIIFAIRPWHAWQNTNPDYYGWNVFSYFTVQSNLVTAAVFCMAIVGLIKRKPLGDWFRFVRGGAVLYMLVTGLVYTFLLQDHPDINASLSFDWDNFVLHQLGPIFVIGWWLLWPSRRAISSKESLWWLIFPIVWIFYTLIRAQFVQWYPYPFLDPQKAGGTLGVTLYILGISLGFVLLGQFIAWTSRVRAKDTSLY